MKPATRQWTDKAEANYSAALLIRKSRKKHSRDIVCFHLQQCVEKYLKARLVEAAITFPKTHDLERLLDLAIPVEPLWATLRPAIVSITSYAVEVRYPGRTTSPAEAQSLLKSHHPHPQPDPHFPRINMNSFRCSGQSGRCIYHSPNSPPLVGFADPVAYDHPNQSGAAAPC